MAKMSLFNSIGIAVIGALCMLQAQPTASQEKHGVIPHAPLLKSVLPDTANQEVAVNETEYAPGGINPRHLHPSAITFYVLSGTGVWQEEGKPPVTLKAGDSFFNPRGSVHSIASADSGDTTVISTWIVDKGKPMSTPVP